MPLELLKGNRLTVMAKGLGRHQHIQRLVRATHSPQNLVFVLNTLRGEDRGLLQALCDGLGSVALPCVVDSETGAQERAELYLSGGVLLVTARILVVDLLCGRVPVQLVSGLVISSAHRVTESTSVGFIIRIYRQHNKTGFVRALSDDPIGFSRGFAYLEKTMRALFVRRFLIWPRFHAAVAAGLEIAQPAVEEVVVPLSQSEQRLQKALLCAVATCLAELRVLNQSVDVSQLTLENSLFKSFDSIVRVQLEPVWHAVSKRTRALVHDLATLRTLLSYLTSFDCVSFFECEALH